MTLAESTETIWTLFLQINSSIIYYCWQLLVAIIFLNCILFSLFLLKSLFFKPKFVENLSESISIDPKCCSNEIVTRQTNPDGSGPVQIDETSSQELLTQSLISNRIQRLYTTDSLDSIEYMSPKNERIRLKEKLQAGYYGNLYKIQIGANNSALRCCDTLCAKLIDMKRLRMIVGDVNGIPSNFLSQSAHLINLFTSKNEIRRSKLMSQYNKQYKTFIDACTKLELTPAKRTQPRHANIVFYDQVLVYDGKCVNIRATHQKIFKGLSQIDKRQFMHLPSLILLVMPFAKHSLRSVMMSNEWRLSSIPTTAEWGTQITAGLNYLHSHLSLPHLNLKPENILLFETESSESDSKSASRSPLHLRYQVKISDCATALLLPTSGKVMSGSSDNTTINTMSPLFISKLTEDLQEQCQYDLHCLGMILLLMLVGYERFTKTFVFSPFPNGLTGTCRYRITDTISRYDRTIIPDPFVDLLRMLLPRDNQPSSDGSSSHVTISQVVAHPALSSRSN